MLITMMRARQLVWVAALTMLGLFLLWSSGDAGAAVRIGGDQRASASSWKDAAYDAYFWRTVLVHNPVAEFQPVPTEATRQFPQVQAEFAPETETVRQTRLGRQKAVRDTMLRCWRSYKKHAWMADELDPLTGGRKDPFGGWAATLVDSLDTLWIMDLKDEFRDAVGVVDDIDFTGTDLDEVNIFETTIRYLGGFLAAFDLSGDARLLRKAAQVGDMIYKAFDTPNHMPVVRWDLHAAARSEKQYASPDTLVAEIGSLSMELTRLSQLTGDPKWFTAAQRITDALAAQQDATELPGLWPLSVNARDGDFAQGSTFTLGAMADSTYEYLPKMALLTGDDQLPVYRSMYQKAVDAAAEHIFFRPMTPTGEDILVSAQVKTTKDEDGKVTFARDNQGQHLVCFLGGNLALGGKLFDRPRDVELGTKLMDGCIYAYKAFPHGIMPEVFEMAPCPSDDCKWDEAAWKRQVLASNGEEAAAAADNADAVIAKERLPKGFTRVRDRRYILRPEAIESVWMLYRVTGRKDLPDTAWDMFSAIDKATRTELANSAVHDVTLPAEEEPRREGSMESFWMGETLKYFYLVFSEPELMSLDEYVFNTEAHPLKRLK